MRPPRCLRSTAIIVEIVVVELVECIDSRFRLNFEVNIDDIMTNRKQQYNKLQNQRSEKSVETKRQTEENHDTLTCLINVI